MFRYRKKLGEDIAKQTGREFEAVVLQYFQERFLYRISISDFRENFILQTS
jgi:hypothetical protein